MGHIENTDCRTPENFGLQRKKRGKNRTAFFGKSASTVTKLGLYTNVLLLNQTTYQ